MKYQAILGVTRISDSYPNVKYKIDLLNHLNNLTTRNCLYSLNKISTFSTRSGLIPRLVLAAKMFWGHCYVLLCYMTKFEKVVYITYPGIFLCFFLSFIPKYFRPTIFLDSFISLYDAIVLDRKLFSQTHVMARIIYFIEKRSFNAAYKVIVDTEENSQYYSQLFSIPMDRFSVIPLSIPKLALNKKETGDHRLNCVFIGTFVPLQGIKIIIDAAKLLSNNPDIVFTIVGDGQDSRYIEDAKSNGTCPNIVWHKGHFPTEFIEKILGQADVCLGIFGTTEKTQRVLPYKLYYYFSAGLPVITGNSKYIKRISDAVGYTPVVSSEVGDPGSLAAEIEYLANNRETLNDIAL